MSAGLFWGTMPVKRKLEEIFNIYKPKRTDLGRFFGRSFNMIFLDAELPNYLYLELGVEVRFSFSRSARIRYIYQGMYLKKGFMLLVGVFVVVS